LKTVVAQPPAIEPNREGGKPIPAAPPTVVAQPPVPESKAPERKAPPASKPNIESFKTVVAEQPPAIEPPASPPPVKPEQIPDSPRGGDEHSALTEQVLAASKGMACPQCDHMNAPGNAYCANCGAIITVAKTVVMSSPQAHVKGRLHLVMEGGQAGDEYELDEDTVIGRAGGDVTFPHDGFMSGRHARIVRRGSKFILTDEGSRNGTFIKIKGEVELKPGDMILVGKQLFRFEV
jgi:FHA domain